MIKEQDILLAIMLQKLGFKEKICNIDVHNNQTDFLLIDEVLKEDNRREICKQIVSLKEEDIDRFNRQLTRFLNGLDKNMDKLVNSMESAKLIVSYILRIEEYIETRTLASSNNFIKSYLDICKLREKHGILDIRFNSIKIDKSDIDIMSNIDECYLAEELIKAYNVIVQLKGGSQHASGDSDI